jgi:DNA-binding CsgD family transcriptional regulator
VVAPLPAHAEFLDRRGLVAGAATAIQGTGDNSLFLAFEGFSSHGFSSRAVPFLDRLRPHLARAISLTALHNDRAQLIVDSLSLSGASAAIVDTTGSLRAANDGFTARMAGCMTDTLTGVRFTDPFLQQQFLAALHRHAHSTRAVQSLAVRNADGGAPFAIHLLPISGAARDVCGGDGILLLIADGTNTVVPNADLLRLLFDLTPAEARLSRLIAEGKWLGQASHSLGISENTARVHLTSVFQKTGVRRQSELVSLLMGLGAPAKA